MGFTYLEEKCILRYTVQNNCSMLKQMPDWPQVYICTTYTNAQRETCSATQPKSVSYGIFSGKSVGLDSFSYIFKFCVAGFPVSFLL